MTPPNRSNALNILSKVEYGLKSPNPTVVRVVMAKYHTAQRFLLFASGVPVLKNLPGTF